MNLLSAIQSNHIAIIVILLIALVLVIGDYGFTFKLTKKAPIHATKFTVPHIIDRIAEAESGTKLNGIGAKGERGAWQFTETAWNRVNARRAIVGQEQHSFMAAHNHAIAREYAQQYLVLLRLDFQKKVGRYPTEDEQCLIWNLGVTGWVENYGQDLSKTPLATRQLLERFQKTGGAQ